MTYYTFYLKCLAARIKGSQGPDLDRGLPVRDPWDKDKVIIIMFPCLSWGLHSKNTAPRTLTVQQPMRKQKTMSWLKKQKIIAPKKNLAKQRECEKGTTTKWENAALCFIYKEPFKYKRSPYSERRNEKPDSTKAHKNKREWWTHSCSSGLMWRTLASPLAAVRTRQTNEIMTGGEVKLLLLDSHG